MALAGASCGNGTLDSGGDLRRRRPRLARLLQPRLRVRRARRRLRRRRRPVLARALRRRRDVRAPSGAARHTLRARRGPLHERPLRRQFRLRARVRAARRVSRLGGGRRLELEDRRRFESGETQPRVELETRARSVRSPCTSPARPTRSAYTMAPAWSRASTCRSTPRATANPVGPPASNAVQMHRTVRAHRAGRRWPTLRSRGGTETALKLAGKGPSLAAPALPLSLPVRPNSSATELNNCFGATYSAAKLNSAAGFKARATERTEPGDGWSTACEV